MESEKELASAEPVDIHWFDPKDYPETEPGKIEINEDESLAWATETGRNIKVPAKVEPRPRQIIEDKGGGQVNVTLAEGETDKYVQLRLNNKTVDSKKSVNGFAQLRFPKGWPVGDFQYKVV